MLAYPYTLTPDDNGTYLVTFPDIPEAAAVGEDKETAAIEALDGLICALEGYFSDRRTIPTPSENGEQTVVLPALETAKVLLLNEMLAQGVKKAEMARRLDVHMPQIDRLLDLRHNTKIDFIEKAAAQLGKRLNISFT
ncbi:type II toxin-antitoxin system HicB family antitoxin [Neisseria animalis]|uniref:Type II toxin-antitoxin system HicB family antitoxin n=1 Tax=Neisseria animalis TaxID=492 RepID=A0A5P3MSF3_NEIAN|nr:type II toxin-antitoxin system HicB family antitoxin [Neisseria animalis]QEY24532.1 type II toxin-antitoxin system HicB family antitoxin [Neisseria animalis]ROW33052.1 type II toxin-antitoxin system HicB family antitoxin [Neisseria animalis]VEE07294.1 Antitoxin HicB [Neisseria animalis]